MTDQTPTTTTRQRVPSREIASAEAQIASVDEQIAEIQAGINDAEVQIEAMEDEIRKRKTFIRNETRRANKLADRRAVFIDTAGALRKLDRP